MNPMDLTLEQRAVLSQAARERAEALRQQAFADFLSVAALRRLARWLVQRGMTGSVACRS